MAMLLRNVKYTQHNSKCIADSFNRPPFHICPPSSFLVPIRLCPISLLDDTKCWIATMRPGASESVPPSRKHMRIGGDQKDGLMQIKFDRHNQALILPPSQASLRLVMSNLSSVVSSL